MATHDSISWLAAINDPVSDLPWLTRTLGQLIQEPQNEHPEGLVAGPVLDKLGVLARAEEWRVPLAKAGALEYALKTLQTTSPPPALRINCWRVVANCCADQEESRLILSDLWPSFVYSFKSDVLSLFRGEDQQAVANTACIALSNTLQDNEKGSELIERFTIDQQGLGDILVQVVKLAKGQKTLTHTEISLPDGLWYVFAEYFEHASPAPDDLAIALVKALVDAFDLMRAFPDDDPESWIPVLSKLFSNDAVQAAFATSETRFMQLLRLFYGLQLQYENTAAATELDDQQLQRKWLDPNSSYRNIAPVKGTREASPEQREMLDIISKVASRTEFCETNGSLAGVVPRDLPSWLILRNPSGGEGQSLSISEALPQCAMLVIGNLVSVEGYAEMLSDLKVGEKLSDPDGIIRLAAEDQTLFLAFALMKHCLKGDTFGERRAQILHNILARMAEVLQGRYSGDTAVASLTLARLLVAEDTYEMFLDRGTLPDGGGFRSSYLAHALRLPENSIGDVAMLQIAVGRLVASILRHTTRANKELAEIIRHETGPAQSDDEIHDEPKPALDPSISLGMMAAAAQLGAAQLEGWFALALLAKSPGGASLVHATLKKPEVWTEMKKVPAATDTSSMPGLQNKLAVLAELNKNEAISLTEEEVQVMESLMGAVKGLEAAKIGST